MASSSEPAVGVHGPWYLTMESRFDEDGARRLVRTYGIPDDHEMVIADPKLLSQPSICPQAETLQEVGPPFLPPDHLPSLQV